MTVISSNKHKDNETASSLSYAPVSVRIKAGLIDGFMMVCIYSLLLFVSYDELSSVAYETKSGVVSPENAVLIACMATILCLFIDMAYFVFFSVKYHGTFGQLTQNLRLACRDGSIADYQIISLRHVPGLIVTGIVTLCGWLFFFLPLHTWMSPIPVYLVCLTHGCFFMNLLVMASNQKHDSISDLWAHTAVIHFSSLKPQIKLVTIDDNKRDKKKVKDKK